MCLYINIFILIKWNWFAQLSNLGKLSYANHVSISPAKHASEMFDQLVGRNCLNDHPLNLDCRKGKEPDGCGFDGRTANDQSHSRWELSACGSFEPDLSSAISSVLRHHQDPPTLSPDFIIVHPNVWITYISNLSRPSVTGLFIPLCFPSTKSCDLCGVATRESSSRFKWAVPAPYVNRVA